MEALIALLVVLAVPTLIGAIVACFMKGGGWLILISLIPAINGLAVIAFFVIGLMAIWWFFTGGYRELGASSPAAPGDDSGTAAEQRRKERLARDRALIAAGRMSWQHGRPAPSDTGEGCRR